jgi:hypothetical protein
MKASSEVALEAADGFLLGLAFGDLACQVGTGLGVAGGPGDGDHAPRPIELAVAAAVQAMALSVARRSGDRGDAGWRAKRASVAKRCAPAARPIREAVSAPQQAPDATTAGRDSRTRSLQESIAGPINPGLALSQRR